MSAAPRTTIPDNVKTTTPENAKTTTADIAKAAHEAEADRPAETIPLTAPAADTRPAESSHLLNAPENEVDAAVARDRQGDDVERERKPQPAHDEERGATPLFGEEVAMPLRHRWDAIRASFVDEPRLAVEQADELVAETMQRLADMFARERSRLEQQFERTNDPGNRRDLSTEDLRQTLRHYRSFFTRLLSV